MKKIIILLFFPIAIFSQNNSEILNGTWNIVNLEYTTEVDLSFLEDVIGFNPGNQGVSGEEENVGFWMFQYPEYTYNNTINFTTETITISIPIIGDYDIPGIPIDLSTDGTWLLTNGDYTLVTTDAITGVESYYEILSIQDDSAIISGMVPSSAAELMEYTVDLLIEVTMELQKETNSTVIDCKNSPRKLINTIDVLGRTTTNQGLQLHIYDDGSIEKQYFIK